MVIEIVFIRLTGEKNSAQLATNVGSDWLIREHTVAEGAVNSGLNILRYLVYKAVPSKAL
jgi:hypothetical protein